MEWSLAVNAAVNDIVKGVPPFPKVRECLDQIIAKADLAVVSGTPSEALDREWEENGLVHYPKIIAGQELGKKNEHLAAMTGRQAATPKSNADDRRRAGRSEGGAGRPTACSIRSIRAMRKSPGSACMTRRSTASSRATMPGTTKRS